MTDRSASPSHCQELSNTTWMLRCRSSTTAQSEPSAAWAFVSEASRSRGDSTRIQLAASSMANGNPCSVRQMSARVGPFSPVSAYGGATPVARSTNNAVASVAFGSWPAPTIPSGGIA